MNFEHVIEAPAPPQHAKPFTIREMIFNNLPNRLDKNIVLKGHQEDSLIEINLSELRTLIIAISPILHKKQLTKGDTVLLASFHSSNELANAILFTALTCHGIRVFIPIFPETNEFDYWLKETQFKAIVMPFKEMQLMKGCIQEKEVIHSMEHLCRDNNIPIWDSYSDFGIEFLLKEIKTGKSYVSNEDFIFQVPKLEDEAVIFTTSGSSGKSKLLAYTQKSFSLSCQSWQAAGLFEPNAFGNACFTPLFTHTIGIRSLLNAIWIGKPLCLIVSNLFLTKPEIARYLLLQMKPGHIIGGPALYNLLIEFFRNFPELKTGMRKELKSLLSIGASYQSTTANNIRSALGISLINAFGTTETQLVLLNKNSDHLDFRREMMGLPLPGVSIGLKATEEDFVFELHVKSAFGSIRTLGEKRNSNYHFTGDLVRYINGELFYFKRVHEDWIKDDFGVKIPLQVLNKYYPSINKIAKHIHWVPLKNKPGLAAIIYLQPLFKGMNSKEVREWVKKRNAELQEILEPFEYEHRHLERFMLENSELPLTRKGTVSKVQILARYEEYIDKLSNPYILDPFIENVTPSSKSEFQEYSNPQLAKLLEAIGLDCTFTKGEKDSLFYQKKGKNIKILDLVGGFGSGLLGHNHPVLNNCMQHFISSGQPALNSQGSLYHYPSLLAKQLSDVFEKDTGHKFKVLFANGGSEAVEMAMHHAYFEWWKELEKLKEEQERRYGANNEIDVISLWEHNFSKASEAVPCMIVSQNCFHGYSSGARSLFNYKKQRNLFSGLLKTMPIHVNDEDENWKMKLEKALLNCFFTLNVIAKEEGKEVVKEIRYSTVIASIIEPVRGEGGIKVTSQKVMDYLSVQNFPLVSDEIQCGLGRSGQLPSYSKASYYVIGKSLGGGFEKISALLIKNKHFQEEFPKYYNTTFSNGELAAFIACSTLDVIQKEKIVEKCSEKGESIKSKLYSIAAKYPDIIETIEGQGLMIGIHFSHHFGKNNVILRNLLENDLLGYVIAGWLFHNKQIRMLPSLSKPNVLRIEPSAYIDETEINLFCTAIEEICRLLRIEAVYELTKFLMNDDPYLDNTAKKIYNGFHQKIEVSGASSVKVGFIANFTCPIHELRMIEPDYQQASDTGLRILFEKLQVLFEGKPICLFSKNLMEGRINFTFYLIPFDTAHLEAIHRWSKKNFYISKIQDAVNLLSTQGAKHISLGAHCSIISGNGLMLASPKKSLLHTGNTLTVSSVLFHTRKYLEKNALFQRKSTIAITGANGNIGSTLALCLSEEIDRNNTLLLIGNNPKKLESLSQTIKYKHTNVDWSDDFYRLRSADIIICCTNSNDPLVFSNHVHPDKNVFIIDISVPGSVDESVKKKANVEFCQEASSVYLPMNPDFAISTHTPIGKIFCCGAEAILAGLYDLRTSMKGHLNENQIKLLMNLAIQEGMFENLVYANNL